MSKKTNKCPCPICSGKSELASKQCDTNLQLKELTPKSVQFVDEFERNFEKAAKLRDKGWCIEARYKIYSDAVCASIDAWDKENFPEK